MPSGSASASSAGGGTGGSSGGGKLQTRQAAYLLQEGEKCLVYYKDLLYEGKVLKVDEKASGSEAKKYLVHYHGWRNSWDSWKTSAEVLKFNDENKRKQAELLQKNSESSAPKSSKKSSSSATTSSANKDSSGATTERLPSSRKGIRSKTASLAGSSCSSTAGGDTLDLPGSRPGTPDSVKSEVSTASSKNAAPETKSQKSKSSRAKDASKQDDSSSSSAVSKKRSRKEVVDNTDDAKASEAKKPSASSAKENKSETVAGASDAENIPMTPNVDTTPTMNQSPASSVNSPGPNTSSESNPSHIVEMPKSLKTVLVDEYDLIMRQKRLVDLPSKKFTVSKIIDEFIESTSDECNQHVAYGVKDMFNVVLGSSLLYKFERAQYEDLLKTDRTKPMVDIYGPEHFLRFFLKINELIEEAKLSKEYAITIAPHLKTMLAFLKDKSSKYFDMKNRYIQAPAEYLRTSLNE